MKQCFFQPGLTLDSKFFEVCDGYRVEAYIARGCSLDKKEWVKVLYVGWSDNIFTVVCQNGINKYHKDRIELGEDDHDQIRVYKRVKF